MKFYGGPRWDMKTWNSVQENQFCHDARPLRYCHNATMARWGKADDAKLSKLFNTPRNGVNPKDLTIEAVKSVHKQFFPEKDYKNFAPLYRAKARAFEVGKSLEGHRQSKSFCFSS